MIAKLVKGKGFRGALEYDLREQKGHILDTNMGGDNPRELAREFGAVRALRPNLTKAVCHVSISLPPDDKLTDDQWKDVAGKYLEGMGFKDSQYVVTKHTDTEHPHIHILANRVSMNGEVVNDSRDYQRQEAIMRRLEREYGLKEVTPSREAERRAPTKGEIECAVRTGKPSAKMALQNLVDKTLHNQPDYAEFTRRLEKSGVEALPNVASTGRISGISYRHNGIIMKGSDLGKGYSWAGLQKRGLTYEQDRSPSPDGRGRHTEAVERSCPTAGRDSCTESPERRGIGAITRTLVERHAQNNLRHGASLGSTEAKQQLHKEPTRGEHKTWNYFLSKTGEQAGKIQNTQSLTANAAQEIRAHTAEMAKQASRISKMQTWTHWGYPLALAVLVSLLWTGFALWRMPDFDILFQNQRSIYELLKTVEGKVQVPAQGGKK